MSSLTSGYCPYDTTAYTDAAYSGRYMGDPYGGKCPTGGFGPSIVTAVAPAPTATAVSQLGMRADEIPKLHAFASSMRDGGQNIRLPPDGKSLAEIGTQAYKDTVAQTPVTAFDTPCCPVPSACQEEVAWRAKWKGCPYTYFADDPALQVEVAPLGDRYWVADLDPLKFERSIMQQAEPNPYAFMQARQLWMQFLMKDWVQTKDPYTRPVSNLDQTYTAQFQTQGPPRFTTF